MQELTFPICNNLKEKLRDVLSEATLTEHKRNRSISDMLGHLRLRLNLIWLYFTPFKLQFVKLPNDEVI